MEKTDAEAEVPILWSLDAKSILSGNEGFLYKSVGKESAHNAGDPGSIPGLGILWRRDRLPFPYSGLEKS